MAYTQEQEAHARWNEVELDLICRTDLDSITRKALEKEKAELNTFLVSVKYW